MDRLTKSLYKKHKICLLCRRQYGSDAQNDSGICPICIQHQNNSRLIHTAKTTGKCSGVNRFY